MWSEGCDYVVTEGLETSIGYKLTRFNRLQTQGRFSILADFILPVGKYTIYKKLFRGKETFSVTGLVQLNFGKNIGVKLD